MRIGVHVSIAGKIYEALERAKALGCDTIQIFSRNPRGWQVQDFEKPDLLKFAELKKKFGIFPIAVHIPYIINLATPDGGLYERSIKAYIEDVKRADALGVEYFVTHLGSHKGAGEDSGIKRFAEALVRILREARPKTRILLENTAGSGDSIGYKFEHIKRILDLVRGGERVGVCLDTAHSFEAGYDIKTKNGLKETLGHFDKLIGLDTIKVVHFNDSLSLLGSHVDRHQHLGKGEIGLEALKRVINHPGLKDAAFIMETPKESDKDDKRNIAIARKMCKKR